MTNRLPTIQPPRLARRLLRRFVAPRWTEELEGDLEEEFRHALRQGHRLRARLTYWRDVLLALSKPYLRRDTYPEDYHQARGPIMLRNYLKIAIRHLKRHKGYAFINVSGLAVGIACCLLIFLFVRDERSYDRFHTNADRIFRVLQGEPNEWNVRRVEEMSPLLAPGFMEALPEVEQAVRFIARPNSLISREDGSVRSYQDGLIYADSNFFDVFSFPLLQGDPATALARPLSLVLTETAARTYFGDANPVGQVLLYNNTHAFEVTGVLADDATRSSLRFDLLASFSSLRQLPGESGMFNSGWSVSAYPTYLLLREGASQTAVEAKIPRVLRQRTDAEHVLQARFGLEPITQIHLYSKAGNTLGPQSDIRYVYLFSGIALLVLLIACINYMNMATARSANRAREVGLRKVVGAHRSQLAAQFLGESMLTSLSAVLLAVGLTRLALPAFETLMDRDIQTGLFREPAFLLLVLALVVVVGVVSGSYPALLLSRFAPVDVLKGRLGRMASGAALRKGLVVFQFAGSVALIVCTLIMQSQLDYVRTKRLGLNAAQVLVLPLQASPIGQPSPISQQPEAFKTELGKLSTVQQVAFSTAVPTQQASRFSYTAEGSERTYTVSLYGIDSLFLQTLGIELVDGRAFSETRADEGIAVLINEAAVRDYEWDEAVGQTLPVRIGTTPLEVVGVVADFHFASLHEPITPLVFMPLGEWKSRFALIRVTATDLSQTLRSVEALWQQFSPEHPFEYFFLDDAFDRLYQAEDRLARLFGTFTLTAILIACLGLFGLTAFSAEQRTKEIGIRKVLGATVAHLVYLLSRDFLGLVAVAFVVAMPVAYFIMERWLEDFAYRIEIRGGEFLMAGLAALGVALLTVSYQAVKAALADPVTALRHE